MKIEICENTFWLALVITICTAIAFCCIAAWTTSLAEVKAYVEHGLEQRQNVGAYGVHWAKPETPKETAP